ncbi:uncharacterized protein LOC8057295 [Sorghum bicolor]|uniref:uncharacterized protein LOC8057295 n=1 Tax=Sorghum bicolor TaxID=4558 RepID=UPI00081AE761|nr:uncharacterized protein LOC8057295 [Sorghum bicolor]|eukprot:XP_021310678.1 uncharacterized protein LOC8057295 [Sorghum bicolor]
MAESSARSSRGSASAGRGGGGGYDGLGSPVAYRVGPLDYTPAKYCYCQLKACRWISWSKKSPGRRYCRCQRSGTVAECAYFVWVDDEPTEWYLELIGDLRDEVWRMRKQVMEQGVDVGYVSAMEHVQQLQKVNEFLQNELMKKESELKAKVKALQMKDKEIEEGKSKKCSTEYFRLLCLFFMGMVVAMVCNGKIG